MHGLLLLAQVDPGKAVEPALSLLDKTVLGSLLILSWALTIALVVQLIRVQNARVADQKVLSDKSERLMNKMVAAFSDMRVALESLKESESSSQRATEALRKAIESMHRTLELLLIGQRRFTPPSGLSRAAIEEERERQEKERKKREGG